MDQTGGGMRRLHNEDWGFDSNCFVCEPRNDGGLGREPRAEATATFSILGEAQAVHATGADAAALDPRSLR